MVSLCTEVWYVWDLAKIVVDIFYGSGMNRSGLHGNLFIY